MTSPLSPNLELFPKLGGDGSGSGPTVLNETKKDLNYLKAMLGDNPPTPGGLFDYGLGLSSLNLVEKKNMNKAPIFTPTLESSAEGEKKMQKSLLKVTAPSFSPGTYEQNISHIRYDLTY